MQCFKDILFAVLKQTVKKVGTDKRHCAILDQNAEHLLLIKGNINCTGLVHKFNDSKDPPDYMLETNKFIDQPGENLAGRDSAVVEIGFREVGRAAEIIERQYDIIEHLSRTLRDIRGKRGIPLLLHKSN